MPQGLSVGASVVIRVERIDAVVHGRNVYDVVRAEIRNAQVGDVQGLRVGVTVNGLGEQLAEHCGVYVAGGEGSFLSVLARTGVVIMVGGDIDLSYGRKCCSEDERKSGEARAKQNTHSAPFRTAKVQIVFFNFFLGCGPGSQQRGGERFSHNES